MVVRESTNPIVLRRKSKGGPPHERKTCSCYRLYTNIMKKIKKIVSKIRVYALVVENFTEIAGVYLTRRTAEEEAKNLKIFDLDGAIKVVPCTLEFKK
mgnify:CR=1 FL=1